MDANNAKDEGMDWQDIFDCAEWRLHKNQRRISEESGIPEPYLSNLRKGKIRTPGEDKIERIASALGITPKDLRLRPIEAITALAEQRELAEVAEPEDLQPTWMQGALKLPLVTADDVIRKEMDEREILERVAVQEMIILKQNRQLAAAHSMLTTGLAIVRKLLEEIEADVAVESGKGSDG